MHKVKKVDICRKAASDVRLDRGYEVGAVCSYPLFLCGDSSINDRRALFTESSVENTLATSG